MTDAAVAEEVTEDLPTEAEAEAVEAEEATKSEEKAKQDAEPSESSTEKPEKDSFQKRIDELTHNWREAQRQQEDLQQQAEYWRQQAEANKPKEAFKPDKSLADFDYDEGQYAAYLMDQAEQRANQTLERARQQESQRRMQMAQAEKQAAFESKASEFAKSVEDYNAVARDPYLKISPVMADAIRESDLGPQMLYHLGKNRDIADRLFAMTHNERGQVVGTQSDVAAVYRELGKIEARLDIKPSTTNAPPPPPRVEAASSTVKKSAVDPKTADKMTTEEWLQARNKSLRGK